MRIIEASFEILSDIDGKQMLQHIEYCARTCYQSYSKQTDDSCYNFVKMILGKNHESCLEHCSFSVKFIIDRGVHTELIRHRLASFSAESSRYCNYSNEKFGNEITVIKPEFFKEGTAAFEHWRKAMKEAENAYFFLLSTNKPEEARTVLPLSLKTETVVTANLREWRHIFKLRTSEYCHPQMRSIMCNLLNEIRKKIPVIFDDI